MNLWPHQVEGLRYLAEHPRAFLLWDPRVGKSRTILTEIQQLQPKRSLIVCPKTVASVWEQEAQICSIATTNLSDGPIAKRALPNEGVVIINYDALWTMRERIKRWAPEYICADEIHLAKSAGARRSKALATVASVSIRARGLSGTPTPQSYKDLYSQYRAINPAVFGTSLKAFADRYLILHPKWPSKVIGYRRLDELREKAFSIAHRVSRAEALGVPKMQEITRRVTLPPSARHVYDQVADVFTAPGINATHALTRSLRLAQITAGILPSDTPGNEKWLHDAKVDAVLGELSEPLESGEKAVVFYRFRLEGEHICAALQKSYASNAMLLSGDTIPEQRSRVIRDFNTEEYPKVLVCQEQLGLGVSFRRADIAVFSSSSFDHAVMIQCRDRIYDGPDKPKTYVTIQASGTIDYAIAQAHQKKQSLADYLLDIGFDAAARGEEVEPVHSN